MGDIGFNFPGDSVTGNNAVPAPEPPIIHFDIGYITTSPGLAKCTKIIMNLGIFLIISLSHFVKQHPLTAVMSYMNLISGVGLWIAAVLLLIFLFHVPDKYFTIPWLIIEFFISSIFTLLLLIGASVCLAYITVSGLHLVIAILGYMNMILYGYDTFLKVKGIQETRGEHVIFKVSPRA